MNINNANLIRSEVMPVLNMLEIITTLEEYTIAIGGVVDGIGFQRMRFSSRTYKHQS